MVVEAQLKPVAQVSPVRQAYAEFFAQYKWDVFGTLTYDPNRTNRWGKVLNPPGPEVIHRNIKHWLNRWCDLTAAARGQGYFDEKGKLHGRYTNRRKRGKDAPVYVLGIEPFKSGRLHAHLLLRHSDGLRDLDRTLGWRLWKSMYGRNQVVVPRDDMDVALYVTKYVTKPGADLYVSDSFDAVSLPSARPGA